MAGLSTLLAVTENVVDPIMEAAEEEDLSVTVGVIDLVGRVELVAPLVKVGLSRGSFLIVNRLTRHVMDCEDVPRIEHVKIILVDAVGTSYYVNLIYSNYFFGFHLFCNMPLTTFDYYPKYRSIEGLVSSSAP